MTNGTNPISCNTTLQRSQSYDLYLVAIWHHFGFLLSLMVTFDMVTFWSLNDLNYLFWFYAIKSLEALLRLDYITVGAGGLFLFFGCLPDWCNLQKNYLEVSFSHTHTHGSHPGIHRPRQRKSFSFKEDTLSKSWNKATQIPYPRSKPFLRLKETQTSCRSGRKGWNKSAERVQWKSRDEYPADSV